MLYASVSAPSSGDNTVVAGVTGKKIRVVSYLIVAAGAVVAKFTDGAAGTGLTGPMSMITGQPITPNSAAWVDGDGIQGHFETSQGNGLVLNLGSAVQVSGHVAYVLR